MIGTELRACGQLLNNKELMLVHLKLADGERIAPHDHCGQEVFFTMVDGRVIVSLDETERHELTPGAVLHFPGEASVSVCAMEDSEFFVYLIYRHD